MNTPPVRPVRIKDIAEHLQISKSAVSHALNGSGRLSSKLREKIRREAEAMGYRKNLKASDLIMSRWRGQQSNPTSRNLALITNANGITHPFTGLLREVATSYARKAGHGFVHIEISNYAREASWKQLLKSRGVEGVLAGVGFDESMLQDPFWNDFVVVKCGHLEEGDRNHGVQEDLFGRILKVASFVESRGYRRIGFALFYHNPYNREDLIRLGALRTLCESHKNLTQVEPFMYPFESINKSRIAPLDPSCEDFKESMQTLITPIQSWIKKEKPDVVVGTNDLVLFALTMGDLQVPEEMAFISLNILNTPVDYPIKPTGFWQQRDKLITQSFLLLEQLLQSPLRAQGGAVRIVLRSEFQEGGTCPTKLTT